MTQMHRSTKCEVYPEPNQVSNTHKKTSNDNKKTLNNNKNREKKRIYD